MNPVTRRFSPVLAKLKGLRGTPFDPFGGHAERKTERALIADYEAGLDRLLAGLTPERTALAVPIAQVPQGIRGFGPVKEASIKVAKADEAKLWAAWEAA